MYQKGTIKLTWINPNDFSILESSMYDTIDSAIKSVGDKKNWMLFELSSVEGDRYSWKLLPYGKYKAFLNGMKFRDSGFYEISILLVAGLSIFGLYKLIKG